MGSLYLACKGLMLLVLLILLHCNHHHPFAKRLVTSVATHPLSPSLPSSECKCKCEHSSSVLTLILECGDKDLLDCGLGDFFCNRPYNVSSDGLFKRLAS